MDPQPQNEYIELHQKRHGKRLDHDERARKKAARAHRRVSRAARHLIGLKAKLFNKKRYSEKAKMKKTIAAHSERSNKHKVLA